MENGPASTQPQLQDAPNRNAAADEAEQVDSMRSRAWEHMRLSREERLQWHLAKAGRSSWLEAALTESIAAATGPGRLDGLVYGPDPNAPGVEFYPAAETLDLATLSYDPELRRMGLKVGRDGNLHRVGGDTRDARDPDEGPAVDWEELHRKQFGR